VFGSMIFKNSAEARRETEYKYIEYED